MSLFSTQIGVASELSLTVLVRKEVIELVDRVDKRLQTIDRSFVDVQV